MQGFGFLLAAHVDCPQDEQTNNPVQPLPALKMPPSGGTRWPLLVALLTVELARSHRISPAPTVTEATVFTGEWEPAAGTGTHILSKIGSLVGFCCLSCIIAMVHYNSLTVEFWWEKIEGNLRIANTEPSMDFCMANTEPF